MFVCARHFYQKPIQTARTTRVVSRMARRVRIVIRESGKSSGLSPPLGWSPSLGRLQFIKKKCWAIWMSSRRSNQVCLKNATLSFFNLAVQCHTQIFQVVGPLFSSLVPNFFPLPHSKYQLGPPNFLNTTLPPNFMAIPLENKVPTKSKIKSFVHSGF